MNRMIILYGGLNDHIIAFFRNHCGFCQYHNPFLWNQCHSFKCLSVTFKAAMKSMTTSHCRNLQSFQIYIQDDFIICQSELNPYTEHGLLSKVLYIRVGR